MFPIGLAEESVCCSLSQQILFAEKEAPWRIEVSAEVLVLF